MDEVVTKVQALFYQDQLMEALEVITEAGAV